MQFNRSIRTLFFVLLTLSVMSLHAQTYAGAGFGTFNVPGATSKFRGWGPTVKLERVFHSERVATYFDLSRFVKKQPGGSATIYDNLGNELGTAATETEYSYLYAQTGLKVIFFGDASEKKVLPYLGGGIALVHASTVTSYESNIPNIDDDNLSRFIFGFHMSAGLQYNLKPVILELRGNFDIDTKQLVPDSDVSNIMSNTRLSILIPLSK